MTKLPPVNAPTDLNLLFGILALQMDFIDREQLITAMQTWLCDKRKKLGAILVEQNILSTPRLILLQALVEEHLKQHKNDPKQSLAAVGAGGSIKNELERLADADVNATLMSVVGDKFSAPDPYATSGVGASTSVGLRFRILRPHARGGLGMVYVAHDEELHREVALKEIQDQHAHNKNSRSRFLLEAEITGRLEHPGIVPVYGLGQYADGRPFYAMRFIKGDSLQDAIEHFHNVEGPSRDPNERAQELRGLLGRFIDVCDAIQYAHDRGVLHRDLKPGNIMLGKYGETLVVDWGLAKPMDSREPTSEESSLKPKSLGDSTETLQGSAVGTPSFMSPEQAGGKIDQLGPASDVYSLGATLYCLLTGKAPVDTSTAMEEGKVNLATILQKVQRGDFPKPHLLQPDVDRALEAICLRAMALKAVDRYRSPRALATDLEHWLADRPVDAFPEPWSTRTRRWVGRHRTLVVSAAAGLLVGIMSLVVLNVILTAVNKDLAKSNKNEKRAKDIAEQKQIALQKANEEAEAARKKAEQAQEETAETLALNTIMLAQTRWNEGQVEMANDLLAEVPPQFRARSGGWSFLKRKFEGSYATLYGHLSPVNGVAFSQDGLHVASVSIDKTLQLWDGLTGEHLWTAKGHQSGITGLAFSPDGLLLASSSWDGTAKVWDVRQRKELVTFKKHKRDVANVTFSPDSKTIASVGDDHLVKVWDPRTGKEHFTLNGHEGPVRGVAFSPDGKSIASSSDDMTVKIWDAGKEGPARLTLKGHSDKIWCVAFSPDGRYLASASDDDSVKIWLAGTDKEHLTLKGHGNDVRSVVFCPDSQHLASASYDKTIKLWEISTGELRKTYYGHTAAVVGVSISPDGQRLASASADKLVKLWDARVKQDILSVKGHQGPIMGAALSHNGRRLATASKDHTVKVWDRHTGQLLFTCEGHTEPVRSVAVSQDGERLASCGDDRTVKVWNGSGNLLWSQENADSVRCVAFSPDGKYLASGCEDHSITLWDAATGKEPKTLSGHTGGVWSLAFSPEGGRLASASSDMTIKIWNMRTRHEFSTLRGHNNLVSSLSFSPDGDRLVSGSYDTSIKIWDASKGQELFTLVAAHTRHVLSVAFSSDGKRLVSGGREGRVKVWDAIAGLELLSFVGHDDKAVQSVSFSDDNQYLVSAGDDNICKLWDVHAGKEHLIIKGHKSGVRSVTFNRDGQRFASAGWDGTVKMWLARTGEELLPLKFEGHKEKVTFVQFNPAGDILATASEDKTVKLWNAKTGAEIRTLEGHTGSVFCVSFGPHGKRLATASADNTVKIWETDTGKLIRTLEGHTNEVRSVAFNSDGKQVVSGGYDKKVKVWDVASGQALQTLDKHEAWVTSVNFGANGKRVVSRDLAEMILVWDLDTGDVRKNKDPDPSPFPANLVQDGKKLVLTTAKRIQIIDLSPPFGEELTYRQSMSRLKPWWHEDLAHRYEKEAAWFGAAFHWSWAVMAAPTDSEKWQSLDQACRQIKNWQHAQAVCLRLLREQPKFDTRFPPEAPYLDFLLAQAHHRLGNNLKARECFDRAALPKGASPELRETFSQLRAEAERELK